MLVKLFFALITFAAGGNSCPKPLANLIVVNFTKSKLTVFVNDKKIGNVGKENQKSFKKKLAVGPSNIKIKKGVTVLHEEDYTVLNEGKDTCKRNKPVIINDIS